MMFPRRWSAGSRTDRAGHSQVSLHPALAAESRSPAARLDKAGRRVCRACAAAMRVGLCVRCGQTRRVMARRDDGVICEACYNRTTGHAGVRWLRSYAARHPCRDGSLDASAATTSAGRARSVEGSGPASAITASGPVCTRCYKAPAVSAAAAVNTGRSPARACDNPTCLRLLPGTGNGLLICARIRPCQRVGSGNRSARTAGPAHRAPVSTVDAAARAGGMASRTGLRRLYEYVRRHPARCPSCQRIDADRP